MKTFLDSLEDYFDILVKKVHQDKISHEKFERLTVKLDEWEEHYYDKEEMKYV